MTDREEPVMTKKHKSAEIILDSDDEVANPHKDPVIPADDNPTNSTSATLTTIDTC